MTTVDNVLYLPDQKSYEDLGGGLAGVMRARKASDRGSLVIGNDSLEFRGTKGTVRLSPVRGVARERLTKVEHGEGADIRVSYLGDAGTLGWGFAKLSSPKKNRQLFETIHPELGAGLASEVEDRELLRFREQARAGAARRARVRMWIGGVVAVAGILVTAITYTVASSSSTGGRYLVTYGAILFGGAAFFQGLSEWRKNRGG